MTSSVAHHTISIQQVAQVLQGARRQGLAVDEILVRVGIPPALLDSPSTRITQAQYVRLLQRLRRATRDELWGLCSRPLPLGSFAQACRLLVGCRTLGEALGTGLRFFHLLLHDFAPRVQVADGVAWVRLVTRGERDAAVAYAQRVFVYFVHRVACWLVARHLPLIEVEYPEAGLYTDAQFLFQAPLRLRGTQPGFRFDAACLGWPVLQSAQGLDQVLKGAPASLIVRYRDPASVTERTRRLLRHHLSGELPSLQAVCRSLAMTPQTLSRRLRQEGQGYQVLKDDLRRDAAINYLARADLSLRTIAGLVGFSEASTFHRAFKHWTGVAPGEYRQTCLGQGAAPAGPVG